MMDKVLLFLVVFSLNLWPGCSVPKDKCEDIENYKNCYGWKSLGYCEHEEYEAYMQLNCSKTCEFCGVRRCPEGQFSCLEGIPKCVHLDFWCDGIQQCENGNDEEDCDWMTNSSLHTVSIKFNSTGPTEPPEDRDPGNGAGMDENASVEFVSPAQPQTPERPEWNLGVDCPPGESACKVDYSCIKNEFWCDGWIADCSDGEDEFPSRCVSDVNKDFIRKNYMRADIEEEEFFSTLLSSLPQSHCTKRFYSCEDACSDPVDLNSDLCACDPDCWHRNDCCFDVSDMCEDNRKPAGIIESCSPKLFGKDIDLTALVIDQCPRSASQSDFTRCSITDNNQDTTFFGAPVYSPDTMTHYRNYYCAKCNGVNVRNLKPWNVWYSCGKEDAINIGRGKQCDSVVYVPPLDVPEPRTCKTQHFTNPSFDETVITVAQLEGKAVQRCEEVYAPVKYNGTLYRNPYCVYLHRNQVGDTKNKTRVHTCDINKELVQQCPNGTMPCRPYFTCIPEDKFCDGVDDCPDRSDEPYSTCVQNDAECYQLFQCKRTQHECIEMAKVCDGKRDCQDGSDEQDCRDPYETNEIEYRNNIYKSLPWLSEYPRISNVYEAPPVVDQNVEQPAAVKRKLPKCTSPLIFDGINCKYNETLTTENREFQKVNKKQDVSTLGYNITLKSMGFYRPEYLKDDPVIFLTKHIQQHPYQVVDFHLGNMTKRNTREGYLKIRLTTQLEITEGVGSYQPTKRDKENFLQIGTEVFRVSTDRAIRKSRTSDLRKLETQIDCHYDNSGPQIQVICTGCAYTEYTTTEYHITETGSIQLNEGKVLQYYQYELRANNTIIVCLDNPGTRPDPTEEHTDRDKWLKVWYGVAYSLSLMAHLVALFINVVYSRKTTTRIFFINYTTMGIIWCLDALLCTVSDTYSTNAQSLHLYGNLGTLAWLLIINFHLLLSVSDGSPAVYFSVDNLVYYHVCGWLCPLGWVLFFFFLSTFKVIEDVTCLPDPKQPLHLNQASQILHFPIWILILVTLLLMMIVIGTTKRLMNKKNGKVDMDVMSCRLQIKMMILGLFTIQSLPWIASLFFKYLIERNAQITMGLDGLHKIGFCLFCVIEGFFLIFVLKQLVDGNLEKIQPSTPSPDMTSFSQAPPAYSSGSVDYRPALPPKKHRGPRPPTYQRPVDRLYTPLHQQVLAHQDQMFRNSLVGVEDPYSRLHAARGGLKNKEYYPVTHVGSPVYVSKKPPPSPQEHQYMPIIRSDLSEASSPALQRARQRTTSSQGSPALYSDAGGYVPTTPLTDKGKHRVPRAQAHDVPEQWRQSVGTPSTFRMSSILTEDDETHFEEDNDQVIDQNNQILTTSVDVVSQSPTSHNDSGSIESDAGSPGVKHSETYL